MKKIILFIYFLPFSYLFADNIIVTNATDNECYNGSIDLVVSDLNGLPPYQISWLDADNNILQFEEGIETDNTGEDFEDIPDGTYILIITDALCGMAQQEVVVECDYILDCNIFGITQGIYCSGGTTVTLGSISAAITSCQTFGLTYSWTFDGDLIPFTTPNLSNLDEAGEYCITVTGNEGYSEKKCWNLASNCDLNCDFIPTSELITCENLGSIIVSVENCIDSTDEPYTYSWTVDGINKPYYTSNVITNITNAGNYCLTVTGVSGASKTQCWWLDSDCQLTCEISGNVKDIYCNNPGSIDVDLGVCYAVYPLTYSWAYNGVEISGNNEVLNVLDEGEYCVTVFDANGTFKQECWYVNFIGIESVDVTFQEIQKPCVGYDDGQISVDATIYYTDGSSTNSVIYTWEEFDISTSSNLSPDLPAGNHSVIITGGIGEIYNDNPNCSYEASYPLENTDTEPEEDVSTAFLSGETCYGNLICNGNDVGNFALPGYSSQYINHCVTYVTCGTSPIPYDLIYHDITVDEVNENCLFTGYCEETGQIIPMGYGEEIGLDILTYGELAEIILNDGAEIDGVVETVMNPGIIPDPNNISASPPYCSDELFNEYIGNLDNYPICVYACSFELYGIEYIAYTISEDCAFIDYIPIFIENPDADLTIPRIVGTPITTDNTNAFFTNDENFFIVDGDDCSIDLNSCVRTVNCRGFYDDNDQEFVMEFECSSTVNAANPTIFSNTFDCVHRCFNCEGKRGFSQTSSTLSKIKVYPNPFNNNIRVQFNKSDKYNLNIYNILGALIENVQIETEIDSYIYSLNTEAFTKGVYLIKIYDQEGLPIFIDKIIKN